MPFSPSFSQTGDKSLGWPGDDWGGLDPWTFWLWMQWVEICPASAYCRPITFHTLQNFNLKYDIVHVLIKRSLGEKNPLKTREKIQYKGL